MLKYQKWQHWNQGSELLVQSRGRRNRTAPFRFVIKGNVWWKRTFLPMVTIAVLHHKHMKLFTPFTPHVIA